MPFDLRLSCVGSAQGEVSAESVMQKGLEHVVYQPSKRDEMSVRLCAAAEGNTMFKVMTPALSGHFDVKPALLVSYVYLKNFLKVQPKFKYRDWVMDSGAFSANSLGIEIKLDDYINTCKELMAKDKTLVEVYALDVIGDWKASLKNVKYMWKHGVEAIPCFHVGEPERELKAMARDYPKIALGGAVGFRRRDEWAKECFSRIWPKKVHGFGFGSERAVMALPWHSVDATSWETGPCRFGKWQMFGDMSIRGSSQDLRSQVIFYLQLEAKARAKWGPAFEAAFKKEPASNGVIRLAEVGSGRLERQQREGSDVKQKTRSRHPKRRA